MRRRKNLSAISLTEEEKKWMADEINGFYLDERGEDIGIIEQQLVSEPDGKSGV